MRQKISLKGVIIGALIDVLGSGIWGMVVGSYITIKHQLYTLPYAEQANQLQALMLHTPLVVILNVVIGGAFTIIGGYIAARIAKHNELLNGSLASFLCVLSALAGIGSAPVIGVLIGVIVNPVLALLGGYLRLLQKAK